MYTQEKSTTISFFRHNKRAKENFDIYRLEYPKPDRQQTIVIVSWTPIAVITITTFRENSSGNTSKQSKRTDN